MKPRLNERIT